MAYIIDIAIKQESASGNRSYSNWAEDKGHVYKFIGDSVEDLKTILTDAIWESVELDGLTGNILVIFTITKDGVYIDSDEAEYCIKNITFTNEPSRFVKWREGQIPHIFTVDRNATILEELD